jgi:hypothetical protein
MSRWYKPRTAAVALRTKFVTDCVVQSTRSRVLSRAEGRTDLLVNGRGGETIRVAVFTDEIDVRMGPALVRGAAPSPSDDDDPNVTELVQAMQIATGFYVYSDALVGFEPTGECPDCGVEVYEWQSECERCKACLRPCGVGADENELRAKRIVEVLLRRRMIELTTPRGRPNVERMVVAFLENEEATVRVLFRIFLEMPDIAELYCDEAELTKVLVYIE